MRQITLDGLESSAPLSSAIEHNGLVYVSGQAAFHPETQEIIGDDIARQTEQTLENVERVVEAAGGSLDDIVKTMVFLTDVDDFENMNEVYREQFSEPYPARSAVEVSDLAADIVVEIEAIAAVD